MANAEISKDSSTSELRKNERNDRNNYWKKVVDQFEKRNASLERKQAVLTERVRFMECSLPSLLIGAVMNTKRMPNVSNNISSCSSQHSYSCASSSSSGHDKHCTSNSMDETKAHRMKAAKVHCSSTPKEPQS